MHQHKREYDPKKEKREDKPVCKTINCVNCGKIIAEGNIQQGKIDINCPHCGVKNIIEALPKDIHAAVLKSMSEIYQNRRYARVRI